MNNFEKQLQVIRLNATRHGPKLVSEALDMLMHAQPASAVRRVSRPIWENILSIMVPLRSFAHDTEPLAQCLEKLFQLVEEKYRDEQHIASMAPLIQRKKAALFSHYNEDRARRMLRRLIRHLHIHDADKRIYEKRLDSHGVFASLKDLHRLAEAEYNQSSKRAQLKRMELYNAFYVSMAKCLSKPAREPLFCGFQHCDLCPRLVVPPESVVCRCEEHGYQNGTTTAYKRALKIHSLTTPEYHDSALEYIKGKLLGKLRHVLPEKYPKGIAHAKWWRLLDADTERLAACDASVQYDLTPIWELLPRTRKLVESKGGNPQYPASVLAVLNPPEANDPPFWKERRVMLNTILTRNFAPFRYELACTEAWLTLHDELFGDKKHGGARPGSGGARLGAGRPRKQE
jgi:hypothetical protein